MKKLYKEMKQNEKGSFTIEASIIFPILIILVLLFIFFSLVIYEKVTLQYKANQIASQLAHSWGSSTMDIDTGEMGNDDYITRNDDGLYWRLTSNNFSNKFGFSMDDHGVVAKKKAQVGEYADDVTLENGLFVQKVEVTLDRKLGLPGVISDFLGINNVVATASHPIIDQTEIIRNTDFMVYGFKKFQDYASEYIPFFKNK